LRGVRNLDDRISDGKVLDKCRLRSRPRSDFAECRAFGGDDGLFGFVKLGGEKPELFVLDVKLAALFANATFAEDEGLFAATECIDNDSPFFKSDVSRHPHDAKYVAQFSEAVHLQIDRLTQTPVIATTLATRIPKGQPMNHIAKLFHLSSIAALCAIVACRPPQAAPPATPVVAHPETGRYQIVVSNEGDRGSVLLLLDTKDGGTWIYRPPSPPAFNGFWSDIPRLTYPPETWQQVFQTMVQQAQQVQKQPPPSAAK